MAAGLSLSVPEPQPQHIHPPLDDRLLIAIEIALRTAWAEILQDRTFLEVLEKGKETEITNMLRERLERIRVRETDPLEYNCNVFERPHVSAEYSNYKNEKPELPDLVFHLSGRPRPGVVDSLYDGLYVECKILDNRNRNLGRYCRNGVRRFVEGDYGWRMSQGMMCAYVRTTQELPVTLEGYFESPGVAAALCLVSTSLTKSTLTQHNPAIYISDHARAWIFSDGTSPGKISVQHLWLPTSGQSLNF